MLLNSSTLASLRFFEAAARLSSFKRAAAELHVTQGAVSQQIKHLEQTLGCKLFFRMPRQIKLTEEGERFAAVVGRALDQIEQEARAIASTRSAAAIRLRAGPSFALRWLVPRLGEFYAHQPNIKLFIVATYGYIDSEHRDFDIAIELVEEPPPALHSEFFMDEYLLPVCTPDYRAKHDLKSLKDLSRCTLLHDGHAPIGGVEDGEWRFWLKAVVAPEVDSTRGQFFSLANLAIEAALANQGIAMGRSALVRDLLETGQLVAPFPARVKSPMKYFLVYPKELAHRSGVRSVIRWLREQVGVLPVIS